MIHEFICILTIDTFSILKKNIISPEGKIKIIILSRIIISILTIIVS